MRIRRPRWFEPVTMLFLLALALVARAETAKPAERQTEALAFNCYTCHGPDGESAGSIPALKGKSSGEILRKLRAFRADGGDPTLMNRIAKGYSDEELARIARFISGASTSVGNP